MQFQFGSTPIAVNIADKTALLATVADRFAQRQGFALATLNLDHLVKLRHSPDFLAAYATHDLVVADGNPIVWLSRLARHPVQLVPGSDMVLPLCQATARAGIAVGFVGSSAATLARAAEELQAQVPGLAVVYQHAPPMGFDPTGPAAQSILADLAAQDIGLCLVALGSPKQERFAALGRRLAPNTGFASFGAGLDFVAGSQTRAPLWLRKLALEWLWRALSSPRRMVPRYAACFAILPGQIRNALRQR